MAPRTLITSIALAALAAAPVFADDGQRRRGGRQSDNRASETREAPAPQPSRDNRAAPRRAAPQAREARRQYEAPRYQAPQQNEARREYQAPRYQAPRQNEARREYQAPRYQAPPQNERPRQYQVPRGYDAQRGYAERRFDNRGFGRRFGSARIIRPSIIEIVPYRRYSYRPSWSIGVYYGAGGSYPYGYTPRGYYDPIPGRYYGGVRITGAPRDAQVFADGYYVGIVNDFDGIFQHMNLEPGPHHIEIQVYGYEPIAFDVDVRPGQTITFRADLYRSY